MSTLEQRIIDNTTTNRTLYSTKGFIYNTLGNCIVELVNERTKEWMENGETESEKLLYHYWKQVMDMRKELMEIDKLVK